MEVRRQTIDYGKVDPVAATELFIRAVLLERETPITHAFHARNLRLRDKLETVLIRARSRRSHDLEEALFRFYGSRLAGVSSIHDLNRLMNAQSKLHPDFLCATEADLTPGEDVAEELALFPDHVELGNTVLPLTYAYTPGEEKDGVTVQIPLTAAGYLTPGRIQWLVPGLREEQAGALLSGTFLAA